MTFYEGTYFFLWLAIILAVGHLLIRFRISKKAVVLTSSIFFIVKIFGNNPKQLMMLLAFVVYQWVLIQVVMLMKESGLEKKRVFHFIILLSILPIVLTRMGEVLPLWSFGFLGISYLTFRSAQIIIEVWDGLIREIGLSDYLSFMLFFPSLSSGPIDRSRRFIDDLCIRLEAKDQSDMLYEGIFYLFQGYVYKMIVSQYLYGKMSTIIGFERGIISPIIYMYLYGLYLFFDFCGYSRMAVGSAYILGIRLPKNFNKPFISENIVDFWNRWHISLSHWFRDYIFNRYTMEALKNKWHGTRLKTAQSAYLVNMVVMGAWHGLTISYLLYGFYHGILLGISNMYLKKSSFHKKHMKNTAYRLAMIIVTFHLVMFGFFIFSGNFVSTLQYLWKIILVRGF